MTAAVHACGRMLTLPAFGMVLVAVAWAASGLWPVRAQTM
jgi:hypothetical protein